MNSKLHAFTCMNCKCQAYARINDMYACMSVCMHVFKCKSCNGNCITFENAQKGGEVRPSYNKKNKAGVRVSFLR